MVNLTWDCFDFTEEVHVDADVDKLSLASAIIILIV